MAEHAPPGIALYEPLLESVIFPEPLDQDLMQSLIGPIIAGTPEPWKKSEEVLARIQEGLSAYEKLPAKLREEHFKPHAGQAWYRQQIVSCAQRVRFHILRGDASWAAYDAFELGQVFQEWQLKFEYDADVIFGAKRRAELNDGAQARRRGSQASRVAEVDRLKAKGVSKRRAFALVGKAEGGTSASTIEQDYYRAKNKTSVF
ncbi:hypothetical protein [Sphingomonas sp. F9_3S_D5_B_2]